MLSSLAVYPLFDTTYFYTDRFGFTSFLSVLFFLLPVLYSFPFYLLTGFVFLLLLLLILFAGL